MLWFSYFSFNVYTTLATAIISKLARSCRKIIKYSKKVGSRVVFPHAFSKQGAHTNLLKGRLANWKIVNQKYLEYDRILFEGRSSTYSVYII